MVDTTIHNTVKTLFIWLAVLNGFDVILTTFILENGGVEVNPIVNWFIQRFGYMGMVIMKLPFLVVLGIVIYNFWDRIRPQFQQFVRGVMVGLVIGFTMLVVYSLSIYTYSVI